MTAEQRWLLSGFTFVGLLWFAYCIYRALQLSAFDFARIRWTFGGLAGLLVAVSMGKGLNWTIFGPDGKQVTAAQSVNPSSVSHIAQAASPSTDWLLVWTAVGAIGALLAGIAAFIALMRHR